MIVADTNLIAYFFIEMEQTVYAQACGQRDPHWIAPPVWRNEFINVLSQYVRTRGLAMDAALKALAAADELVETVTLRGLDEQIIRWSADHGLAGYDAEFVIAAETTGVRLVAADKTLLRECKSRAVSPKDFAEGNNYLRSDFHHGRTKIHQHHLARRQRLASGASGAAEPKRRHRLDDRPERLRQIDHCRHP